MQDGPRVWVSSRTYRKRKSYHVRWLDVSGRWRSKAVEGDRKCADREAARLENELIQGTHRDVRRVSWAEFATDHVEKIPGKVNGEEAERTLRMFAEACSPYGPHTVTFAMVERFVQHLRKAGNSTATVNKRLRYLRAAFNKAIKRGRITRNPMDGWEWQREEDKIPRALTDSEKTALLKACPTDQWKAFAYGCRRGELLSLEWGRIDLNSAQAVITGTKAHRDRVQPLNADAVSMLRKLQPQTLRDGGPFRSFNGHNMPDVFKRIVKKAGVEPCTIHDLRRTFCTDLARLGVNQLVVQRLAGHAASSTTARYYQRVDDSMKRDAIEKLACTG